jgi:hypothetical protein
MEMMTKKQIKNTRNPESDEFLLDIQIDSSIEKNVADSLTKDIAHYIQEREKIESCLIRFIGPKEGEVSFVINNNQTKRMLDFSWYKNKLTEASILYPDGTHHKVDKRDLPKINEEIHSSHGNFIESSMDFIALIFVDHLIETN